MTSQRQRRFAGMVRALGVHQHRQRTPPIVETSTATKTWFSDQIYWNDWRSAMVNVEQNSLVERHHLKNLLLVLHDPARHEVIVVPVSILLRRDTNKMIDEVGPSSMSK